MTQKYIIRRMVEAEVQTAIDWARDEGWNPGLSDARCFFQADPNGFFIGLLNDEPIATGCAIAYDDHFAFCGLYIVKREFRSQGYGIQLTRERLNYLGNRITGLDGVLEMTAKYQQLGYVPAHKNSRFAFNYQTPFSTSSEFVVDLRSIPFAQIEEFDRRYFPAARDAFLRCWITQPASYALGYVQDQMLRGYGVIRKCFKGYKIGPLFAESSDIAQKLFEGLCMQIEEGTVLLDIPEPNQNALSLVKHYKMTPAFEVIRMYRNGTPDIDLQGIYGISTFELG